MSADLWPEDLDQQIRNTIDDFWVVREIGCSIYHPENLDHRFDTTELAYGSLDGGQEIQSGQACVRIAIRDIVGGA
ncbi:hypothetical protein OR16_08222 [Cupriavidus basilensis OR16]|uniref:Uncharacterized protein n=1 Tax=Cupriavidus basilensis OR16 TaxID=1127483 RepID=H1S1U6_9BURK|nr:hypothetical protein OR16_08222 [Cupriavidus basilensis OR16]